MQRMSMRAADKATTMISRGERVLIMPKPYLVVSSEKASAATGNRSE
jgi:hypothetical protein